MIRAVPVGLAGRVFGIEVAVASRETMEILLAEQGRAGENPETAIAWCPRHKMYECGHLAWIKLRETIPPSSSTPSETEGGGA